jgi:AIPR protein/Abortive infection phage resistance protein N-terminal domain
MTLEEFRADLLAAVASRAEVQSCGMREAFVLELLERLAESGEIAAAAESCSEILSGHRGRKLEIDAWGTDDADDSLHLFVAIWDGDAQYPQSISLTDAREQGFNRVLGVFEQSREGWLTGNVEESRPLWALARHIQSASAPAALRLHVLTDRPISERLREIPSQKTRENVPITFQIWDVTRLKRVHDALSVRDDLIVDFSHLSGGGLPVLPASVESGDYDGYLAVIPGNALSDIYTQHGSRLLEGNVRTFLGRSGKVNKGIAATIAKEPAKFFAYNNGIAATASAVTTVRRGDGSIILTSATDLQIVNGAQTTASLAQAARDRTLVSGTVFVPMKLSVVAPAVASDLIPLISRFANSQNGVRPSDFFANHPFHRRIEEISRRIFAPAVAGSQVQTHWYYERARGQHLNDQAGLTSAKRNQFLLMNPRRQVITKTDLAKVECCFNLEPDLACKGAEKAFVAFAERISNEWNEESRRALYGDDWLKSAVARVILFRAAEASVSRASWYEGGYRAQIVAYTCARLAQLALEREGRGGLDYLKIWTQQSADEVLQRQIDRISEVVVHVLQNPPVTGQNVSEWAKQQACRRSALDAPVPLVKGIDDWIVSSEDRRARQREQRAAGLIDSGLDSVMQILTHSPTYWESLREFCRKERLLLPEDEKALVPAFRMPGMVPTQKQAVRLLQLIDRAVQSGWRHD